jgi:hypothetical protein
MARRLGDLARIPRPAPPQALMNRGDNPRAELHGTRFRFDAHAIERRRTL